MQYGPSGEEVAGVCCANAPSKAHGIRHRKGGDMDAVNLGRVEEDFGFHFLPGFASPRRTQLRYWES